MSQGGTFAHEQKPLKTDARDGEMHERTRTFDWSQTPIGPAAKWPQSLKTVVRIMLDSRYAMWLGWGDDLTFFYNDAYGQMTLGPRHPWALGRPAREVWSEIWSDIGPRAQSVVSTGKATWDEGLLLFLERQGFKEETYHTFSYSPVPDDEGHVGGLLCVVTEDTERTIGERRLRTLRELATNTADTVKSAREACQRAARTLAENPRDLPFALIYLLDAEGPIARLGGMAGLPEASAIAPASIDLSPERRVDFSWPLGEVLQTGEAKLLARLDGRFDTVRCGAWPEPPRQAVVLPLAKPGQSRLAGFVIAGISARLEYKDGYRGFLDLLSNQIATSIANARAYEEERKRVEMLAELDRAKTVFFSNVSHEFRTPLTLILGPLQDAISQNPHALPPEIREDLTIAHRNSLRLLKLVNTLLDFSRIEAARVQPNFEPTDLAAVTCDLASVFRSAIERAKMRLVLDCPSLDEPVYVDREMWEKIVLNLLSNAFKYTFDGEICVSLRRVDDHVELAVKDTGTGIPAEELPRLFERFHRIQGARARTHEGTGIGLALVHELVKLHGGVIRVESQIDRGTTFFVSLPLGTAHLPADRIAAPSTMSSTATGAAPFVEEALHWLPQDRSPDQRMIDEIGAMVSDVSSTPDGKTSGRILLADDNVDLREYLRRLLATRYEVEAVGDGHAALEAARRQKPDLIVTDVMMPRLDGFGLLHEVRNDADLRETPVVMLSARAGEEARVEGVESGADDYLVKPFSARELVARVGSLIEMARFRKQASAELEETNARLQKEIEARKASAVLEARLAAIVESSDDAIVSKTLDGIITSWNVAAERLFGYSSEEAVGKSILLIVPPERHGEEADILRKLRKGERTNHFETERVRKGGRRVDVSITVSPIRDSSGTIVGASKIARDVTEQKRAEREREQLLAAERNARGEAQRANQLKDEFLATLSHELRTPLNAIMGWAQLMGLGTMAGDEMQDAGRAIERNARTQKQLIDDLLDMSRIISGKLRLDLQQVDPISFIDAAVETIRPSASVKEIRIERLIDPLAGPVSGDPSRLQQVMWNLLSNAVKFTPKGGRIQVRLERVNSHIELSVSDTGQGIDPAFLPHLFERFRQADASTTRKHGGLGIGLAIVKEIVELHGGTVRAKSAGDGQGAAFVVTLPLLLLKNKAEPTRVHPTASSASVIDIGLTDLSGLKILFVDDEPDARSLVKRLLEECGAQAMAAESAQQALDLARGDKPDVLISDIGMPETDGYEFLRQFRMAGDSYSKVPAIALTAFARSEDRTRALRAGFISHVAKPIEPSELLATIAVVAGRVSQSQNQGD
jgi:PAS domain S-box-containing protein